MQANEDFKDLFSIFNEEGVEYLIVEAYPVMYYAEPRFTKGIDIWVNPTMENAGRVWNALRRFGAPLENITKEDFVNKELVYQIGIAPNRIDILMDIGNIPFNSAYRNSETTTYDGVTIKIVGKEDLIQSKKTIARKQDLIDIERLEGT